ncbi:hypothetical protein [Picrophilus oshimae]|uniref:Uncharacterized protein n=1 Tax=Picrophilus torridus (strain ATCC 700027 / DSM 9790 / JCM 10055 / NBRC 100828 / KAW 2/3) TaxID=1122961 RepID=Q6KZ93_PICTO|nr:hypothetical protein [Picrophilus oshimae]AAT43959.1 hypothetical protein PTO1374 [Picrophilus oshimae DSM 9789]SMD30968.1 hypothetical protein SAMN02745355_0886 [Picrophilus oshimae DSM 9789]
MYKCNEIKTIRVRYMDNTIRDLNPDEIKSICELANKNNDSIERTLKKIESKEVRYVEINIPEYQPEVHGDEIVKPRPPY